MPLKERKVLREPRNRSTAQKKGKKRAVEVTFVGLKHSCAEWVKRERTKEPEHTFK